MPVILDLDPVSVGYGESSYLCILRDNEDILRAGVGLRVEPYSALDDHLSLSGLLRLFLLIRIVVEGLGGGSRRSSSGHRSSSRGDSGIVGRRCQPAGLSGRSRIGDKEALCKEQGDYNDQRDDQFCAGASSYPSRMFCRLLISFSFLKSDNRFFCGIHNNYIRLCPLSQ